MSIYDGVLWKHRRELEDAEVGLDQARADHDDLMGKSFLNPKAASQRMDKYRGSYGDDALYKKLGNHRHDVRPFGRRPGSMLAQDGYSPGAGDRRKQSQFARDELPDATRRLHQAERRKGIADGAYKSALGRQDPGQGGPGGAGGPGAPHDKDKAKLSGPSRNAEPHQTRPEHSPQPQLGGQLPSSPAGGRPPRFSQVDPERPREPIAFNPKQSEPAGPDQGWRRRDNTPSAGKRPPSQADQKVPTSPADPTRVRPASFNPDDYPAPKRIAAPATDRPKKRRTLDHER